MSKILFVFEADMPTVSITRDIFIHLAGNENIIPDFAYLTDVNADTIDNYYVIIFIRPANILSWRIAENARNAGHLVVTLCDDDLLNLPKTIPAIPWRKRGLTKTLENSHVIWSSSWYILDKYRPYTYGGRSVHTDTIVRDDELTGIDISHKDNRTVKIVYAAGTRHEELFYKYVRPIVPKLVDEYGDNISFTFVGVHPDMGNIKCEYVSGMPLIDYRRYMRANSFDIGLAPLNNDDFSKCKYFNKFIEYTMHGIVGIYSNVEPYTYVIKDGENGFLADNTPESWLNAIRKAINEKMLRQECVENAIDYLRQYHSEDAIINRLKSELPEITGTGEIYGRCRRFWGQKVLYYLSRPLDWMYLTGFYLRHNGMKDVLGRAYSRILGKNAYSRNRIH